MKNNKVNIIPIAVEYLNGMCHMDIHNLFNNIIIPCDNRTTVKDWLI